MSIRLQSDRCRAVLLNLPDRISLDDPKVRIQVPQRCRRRQWGKNRKSPTIMKMSLSQLRRVIVLFFLLRTFCTAVCEAVQNQPGLIRFSDSFEVVEQESLPVPRDLQGMTFEQIDYPDFDATEWQVRLAAGKTESVLFRNSPSADFVLEFPKRSEMILHWSKGSHGDADDFRSLVSDLQAQPETVVESFGGRSSDGAMPYFNVAGTSGGLILAVGWTGDWRVSFQRQSDNTIRIKAGLKEAHFHLPAGETVRLPSVLLMPYRGDWTSGQNKFRRFMKQKLTPANHDPLALMPVAASVHGMLAFNDTSEENLRSLAIDISDQHLPIDTFWLDAGWNEGGFPGSQGNPNPDPKRFPNGLKPIGQLVDSRALRFLVWFEPERVMRGTWLHREHPEWILRPQGTPESLRYQETDGFHLLNLGNPEARRWMTETVSQCITDWNVSIYRQDFNLYPAWFWASRNTTDEVGLCEVRYINGLYDFLDELQRRHPKLIIDSCAAGGRRMDFEMMRRSVVLWRSDSCWGDPTYPQNVQDMTAGLSQWIPLHGLGAAAPDNIALRSGMGACSSFAINYRDPAAVESLRKHLDRYLPVRHLFMEDFYPLHERPEASDDWIAFQFHSPQTQHGVVQAFRGATDQISNIQVKFRAVDRDRRYIVTNWDEPASPQVLTGAQLLDEGTKLS
ncbi:MAG: alpha-galactosidase, partial [Planctomycetaceae bacterium]|nr:alpha-galactosidase [Planctomycetaceae bacterium]